MARKKTMSAPRSVKSEDESKDTRRTAGAGSHRARSPRKMSKTDAIRAAVAEGIESPGDGVDFIRKRFGLEMSKQHFSATKSKLKSAEGAKKAAAKAAPKAHPKPPRRGGRSRWRSVSREGVGAGKEIYYRPWRL